MDVKSDTIELSIPFKAEYVSIARLTVSGIASKIGFDIDCIEDIKVAVAEVCNKLVNAGSDTAVFFRIRFEILDGNLRITFYCEDSSLKCIFDESNDTLALSIINALMDTVEVCSNNTYVLSMSKAVEENF